MSGVKAAGSDGHVTTGLVHLYMYHHRVACDMGYNIQSVHFRVVTLDYGCLINRLLHFNTSVAA